MEVTGNNWEYFCMDFQMKTSYGDVTNSLSLDNSEISYLMWFEERTAELQNVFFLMLRVGRKLDAL